MNVRFFERATETGLSGNGPVSVIRLKAVNVRFPP